MLSSFRNLRNQATKQVDPGVDIDGRLSSVIRPSTTAENLAIPSVTKAITSPKLPAEVLQPEKRSSAFHLIDPSNDATKSLAYSQYVQDFIYSTGSYSRPYSDPQLEMAFWTSVYLFAALRRVSNLISKVKVVAEFKNGDNWQRLPETSRLNELLSKDMSTCLKIGYLNYAIYGSSLTYKTKTVRAQMAAASGKPIYNYLEGAVAGLLVLDNPGWQLNETTSSGYNSLKGVFLNYDYKEVVGDANYLDRREFVYVTDWNPRDKNRGRSIASVAIHEAVTNAAIARWASEYFTRGTLPMLLVSMVDNPAVMTQSDLAKQKRFFEEQYQGQAASLRSVFVDQEVKVNEIGITADRVAAPELNKNALEGISAAVGIERDLIIAPEGGTQGRHQTMVQQAWNDTVIPLAEGFVKQYRQDLGLPDNVRLAIDVSHIAELEADRGERSTAELAVFEKSIQTINETRLRLNQKPIKQLKNFLMVNGELKSIEKILKQDQLLDDKAFTQVTAAWDSDLLLKSEALAMMNRRLPPGEKDGYKSKLAAELQQLTAPAEPLAPEEPPTDDTPPENDGGPSSGPKLPPPTEPKPPEAKPPGEFQSSKSDDIDLLNLLAEFDDEEDEEFDEETDFEDLETIKDMSIFVSIPLTNNPVVVEMKRKLARAFGEQDGIKWKSNDSLHITLAFSEEVSDEKLESVIKLIPSLYSTELTIGPLRCFEQERRTVVALNVLDDQGIISLRQAIVGAFQAYGIKLSEYSAIGNWNPHITMCEIDKSIEIPDFNYKAKISPSLVTFSRTDENPKYFIKLKENVYSTRASIDPRYIDTLQESIKQNRKNLIDLIIAWKETGTRVGIPEKIAEWISEYLERPDCFSAAIQACETGMFDDDATTTFNPLEKFLKGIQKTATDELSAWKRVAKSNLQKARERFQVSKLPVEIEEYVRSQLKAASKSSSFEIDPIFAKAFSMLDQDGYIKPTSHEDLSTIYDRLSASEDEELKSLIGGL